MSTSPADPERQRLFSPTVVAVFGALVTLMLVLAFPREKLEARLLGGNDAGSLTIAYLEAWLRADPDNEEVLAELTNQYLKGSRIADAQRTLERLSRSKAPGAPQMALAIRLSVAERQLYELVPDDPKRPARIAAFDSLLRRAADFKWSNEQLATLAGQARALNDGALAAQFYKQLVAADPANAKAWRVADAEVQLGNGRYQEAADAWFAAQADAPTLGERRALFLAGLRALQSGNLLPQALDAANRHVGDLADDPDTLRYLTRLAMAAGRPDVAEIYVKRLLKMSLRRRRREDNDIEAPRVMLASFWTGQAGSLLRVAASAAPGVAATAPPNTADEDLAYSVFLANGDVANAERVAKRALDKDPQSNLWRKRLAQVAEWNQDPEVALNNWLALAQSTGDEDAWKQVARLAPGLDDDAATLAAMLHQSERSPTDLKLVDQVVAAYERLADPDGGLRFLMSRARGAMREPLLNRYAVLAERKGDDDLALRTWRTLEQDYGPNAAYGRKIALILYTRTQFEAALAAMQEAQRGAAKDDGDFWRFNAQLAMIVQQRDAARAAYRALMDSGNLAAGDYDAMISFFDNSPIDAGRIAELAYRQGGDARMLQQAMYYYQRAYAWGRIAAMLDALTPEQRAAAEKSAAFLLARAEYRRQMGDMPGAASDVRRAVTLEPDNIEAAAAYIWDLNDRGTSAELRRALRKYASEADGNPSLWGAYAAAYQRLGDGRHVLYYLHKQAPTSIKDPLWRLTWADALELNGRTDDAWRVRRNVWIEMARHREALQPTASDEDSSGTDREERASHRVSLAQQFSTGDRSRALLIELLRADRKHITDTASPTEAASELGDLSEFSKLPPAKQQALRHERMLYSSIAREAAISWAQDLGESDMERAWLTRQYLVQSARPVYAEAQLAIEEGDVNTLERLLDSVPDQVPRQNKVDAEALTGRYTYAQSDAFDSLTRLPDDEVMQSQLGEQLMRSAQAVGAALRYVDQGPLRFTEESVTGSLRLTSSQSLQLRYMQRDQWADAFEMPNVPKQDRLFEGIYRHQGQYDEERITLGGRQSFEDFVTARVEGEYTWSSALTLNWALGYNQAATETTQLQVGGTKDIASLGFNYHYNSYWFAGGRYEYARFHGQDRSSLGDGHLVELEGGYKIKFDYPDYTVRVVFAHGQYNANGTPGDALRPLVPPSVPFNAAAFMPQTFTQAGLLFSFGEDLQDPHHYSKGWRPFFSAGPLRDSRTGWSGQVLVGAAGSVFGGDQAVVYGSYEGVSATSATSVKEVGIRYQWFY
ncbi:tetratricopeptide repeat protein [Paraburkholderia dinghuensis]|uniref:PelB C-terminal domain-containing protein n=1 Tax=Paraburkholderia dinghuensis TaxID=2305225 RepID=A0A3N6MT00_9BURK|nr:tetratricopeptide repeat protein [Paraburkholderia dinghuensis]RQH07104.1 hypothetical protein D1Y85_10585 [Paraburkholderia dinghuensis]